MGSGQSKPSVLEGPIHDEMRKKYRESSLVVVSVWIGKYGFQEKGSFSMNQLKIVETKSKEEEGQLRKKKRVALKGLENVEKHCKLERGS